MTRLHSLVCFQTFPFPHCHFLSDKFACTICTVDKSAGDARRLTAACTTAPSCNTALLPSAASAPKHDTSHQPTPYVWRSWPRSCPTPWQWAGRRTMHRFVPECRVSPGLLPGGTHTVTTMQLPWLASAKADGSLSWHGLGHRGQGLFLFCTIYQSTSRCLTLSCKILWVWDVFKESSWLMPGQAL